ncbi:MAG: hypothetical protein ACLFQX_06080 [Candidatus Kapaibacterium sp.]
MSRGDLLVKVCNEKVELVSRKFDLFHDIWKYYFSEGDYNLKFLSKNENARNNNPNVVLGYFDDTREIVFLKQDDISKDAERTFQEKYSFIISFLFSAKIFSLSK